MAEYIERKAALRPFIIDKNGNRICETNIDNFPIEISIKQVKQILKEIPTADVVEVVRCKDCKHYREFRTKRYKQAMRMCYRMGKHDMEYFVKPNDFCSCRTACRSFPGLPVVYEHLNVAHNGITKIAKQSFKGSRQFLRC